MKNILLLVLSLCTAGMLRAQPGSLLTHIPSDAEQVIQVNLASLAPKIDWSSVMKLSQGHKLGKTNPMDPTYMPMILNSGIDLQHDIVIALSKDDSLKYTTILVHLTDSGKFAATLRAHLQDARPLHLEGSKDRMIAVKNNVCGWNDHIAVLVVTKKVKPETSPAPAAPRSYGHLGRRCLVALRGVSTGTPFTTNPTVLSILADDADIHFWSRHGAGMDDITKLLGKNPAAAQLGGMAQMVAKPHQDPSISSLRFEPGKIVFSSLKLVTPAEEDFIRRLAGHGLSPDLETAVPAGPLLGAVAIHYDMAVAADTIHKIPAIAMVESKLKEKGLSVDDFIHALKGDILVLAYAPENKKTDTGAGKKPSIFVLAALNDKSAFNKIAPVLKMSDADAAAADPNADTAHHGLVPFYSIKGDLVVLGSDRRQVNTFFTRPAAGTSPAAALLTNRANNSSFTLGIDMQNLARFAAVMMTKGDTIKAKDQKVLDALSKIDGLLFSTGAVRDNAMESYFEVRMTDQDKNALASLLDIIASMSKKPDGTPGQ
jgi:uncharacterized protein DUF4836